MFCSIEIIEKITLKYKIPSVIRSVQTHWHFSTQNPNNAIGLIATQTVKIVGRRRNSGTADAFSSDDARYITFLVILQIRLQISQQFVYVSHRFTPQVETDDLCKLLTIL